MEELPKSKKEQKTRRILRPGATRERGRPRGSRGQLAVDPAVRWERAQERTTRKLFREYYFGFLLVCLFLKCKKKLISTIAY